MFFDFLELSFLYYVFLNTSLNLQFQIKLCLEADY